MRKWILVGALASVFALGFLTVIVSQRDTRQAASRQVVASLKPLRGNLAIYAINDLRVGNSRIVLCGTSPPNLQSVWALATEAARREFRGVVVSCNPVGLGTPCDGKTGAKLGAAIVVQCLMSDGADLATALTEKGLLCGQPSIVGSQYKPC